MATVGPTGVPHLVAMWYGVVDGQIWFETKAQVAEGGQPPRDPRITVLLEDGLTYDTLRGVSIEGTAVISRGPRRRSGRSASACGSVQRPVHRRGEAARGVHAPQAGRRAGRRRPHPHLGPPQARHGPDPARRAPPRRSRPGGRRPPSRTKGTWCRGSGSSSRARPDRSAGRSPERWPSDNEVIAAARFGDEAQRESLTADGVECVDRRPPVRRPVGAARRRRRRRPQLRGGQVGPVGRRPPHHRRGARRPHGAVPPVPLPALLDHRRVPAEGPRADRRGRPARRQPRGDAAHVLDQQDRGRDRGALRRPPAGTCRRRSPGSNVPYGDNGGWPLFHLR